MRIVVDTNVIISALVFGGVPRRIFELVEAGYLDFFYSQEIQAETQRILRDKFDWDEQHMKLYLTRFWKLGSFVACHERVQIVADDPDDDRILECALAANADVVISGDQHLLKLEEYKTIPIMTPRQFLSVYSSSRIP